jgi:hypothetical protein
MSDRRRGVQTNNFDCAAGKKEFPIAVPQFLGISKPVLHNARIADRAIFSNSKLIFDVARRLGSDMGLILLGNSVLAALIIAAC